MNLGRIRHHTYALRLAAFQSPLLALCLFAAGFIGQVRAEDAKPPDPPPEAVGRAKNFLNKILEAQRKRLDDKMDKLIAEIAKATDLKEDGVKALKVAAAKAEDAEQSEISEMTLKAFAKEYAENAEATLAALDQPEAIQMAASQDLPEAPDARWTRTVDQPAWKNALAKVLTPEQATAWEKSKQPDQNATQKAIDTYLDTKDEAMRARAGGPIQMQAADIASVLSLSKERAEALDALAKKAVDATVALMRKDTAEALLKYSKEARDNIFKNGRSSFFVTSNATAEKQAVWQDGLAKLLTDAERAQLKTAAEFHRLRRAQALGLLAVQLWDERLAFTESQRARVQPIAEKIIQAEKTLFPDKGEQYYYRYEKGTFYKAAKAAKPDEIRPILDEAQWKHWQELPALADADIVLDEGPRANQLADQSKEPAGPGEPEDLEGAVADYLVAQTDGQFKENRDTLLLQVEDLQRVAQVGTDPVARLRTAALGAADTATGTWLASTESNLRGELQNATAENVQQKLASMSRYSFMRVDLDILPIWKKALSTELTPDQSKTWQTERDARENFKNKAVTAFLVAELDRKIVLTKDQCDKLAVPLLQTIQEYAPDIRSMFSYRGSLWYLQSYSLYVPVHAVPDNDLKAILTPAQFTAWTGSQECTYSASYWDNIRNSHDRRTKKKP